MFDSRHFVCTFDRMREVDLGSGRALLIKQHGEFSAMGHKCPHYGAPLVKGSAVILTLLIQCDMITFKSLNVISHHFRCVVKRTCALSLAWCMFQHCNRRHWGLPWAGQPAYLPGDNPPAESAVFSHIPCIVTTPSAFNMCAHGSCLFTPGQSWKGQSDHSCKQAGNN